MKKTLSLVLFIVLSFILISCNEEIDDFQEAETYIVTFIHKDEIYLEEEYQKDDLVSFPKLDSNEERIIYWTIKDSSTIFGKEDLVKSDLVLVSNIQRAYGVSFYPSNMDSIYVFSGDMPIIPKDPEMDNQVFKGWFEDRDCLIPYNWNKPYLDLDYLTIYAKWEKANAPFYFTTHKYGNDVYYELYVTKYASGKVVIPSYKNGIKIMELHRSGEYNNATSFYIPETINNINASFFLTSPEVESIEVNSNNIIYTSVDGVLYSSNISTLNFYPSNKSGDTYRTNAELIAVNAFSNTRNLKHLFLDKAFNFAPNSFSNSSIENIVITEKAYFNYNTFRDYNGNIFLNAESYDFKVNSNINVYLKGQWSIIDGIPVIN